MTPLIQFLLGVGVGGTDRAGVVLAPYRQKVRMNPTGDVFTKRLLILVFDETE